MDITDIPKARGFIYLAAVVDWFICRVLAWRVSITLEIDFCIEAIAGGIGDDTIINSDRSDQIDDGNGLDTVTAIGGGSLDDETINVTVNDDGDGSIVKTTGATTHGTDTVTSVETFIADESAAENDGITLTTTALFTGVSGFEDASVGTFTPDAGGGDRVWRRRSAYHQPASRWDGTGRLGRLHRPGRQLRTSKNLAILRSA